jgi:hypothetical protein
VNNENDPIDFYLYNPRNEIIFKLKKKAQMYHEFNATIPGKYKFVLENRNVKII